MGRNKKKEKTVLDQTSTANNSEENTSLRSNGNTAASAHSHGITVGSVDSDELSPTLLLAVSETGRTVKSRMVFIASVCHVCKSGTKCDQSIDADGTGSGGQLFTCASCRMISYCSKEHQSLDWEAHKQLCHLIRKVLKKENKKYLYDSLADYTTDETQWLQIRHGYLNLFQVQLNRDMHPYEKEMVLFPRVCFSCRKCTGVEMTRCDKCCMVYWCQKHNTQNHSHCNELKLWLELVRFEAETGLIRPLFNPKSTLKFFEKDFSADMPSFFRELSLDSEISNEKEIWLAGLSDVATVPLSIIWAIHYYKHSNIINSSLIVHLLGAEYEFEGCCVSKWETFLLHFLSEVKSLNIVLIGPELPSTPSQADLCSSCNSQGRKVILEQRPGYLYHEYATEEDFIKPDIICAFNCGIYRKTGYNGEDTWGPTIPLLAQAKLVITTAYTETESDQDRSRIQSECVGLKCEACSKNPFRSLRPQRTLVNENKEPLMYKNQFINVFL